MEKLVFYGFNHQHIPPSFIIHPEKRPRKLDHPVVYHNTPIIDLKDCVDGALDRSATIQQIFKAIEEFGFFQLVNDGVHEELMEEAMEVSKEFFEMPVEDRLSLYREDPMHPVRVSSSIVYENEEVHYWRDKLRHLCHPVEEFKHLWPSKPTKYKEVIAAYSVKVRALALKLLELICEGLGLQPDYFNGELSQMQSILINHYPPSPDPSLTLGLPKHIDPNVITILLQGDSYGFQVLKDGEWIDVKPLPNTHLVVLGHQLQIISNEKLKGVEHRVVSTNVPRTTIAMQIHPSMDCVVEPAKEVIDEGNPAKYRSFTYQEFVDSYLTSVIDTQKSTKPFKILA
ncbi:hypothetical protein Scep_010616 [Stephania cephalantha]|uniref:Fe2OG dioxygenase domain-containing protein n=1 Tax=Stephania cephalantha TaxID=152367 RepID=A0AAP0PH79_9MAGN